MTKGRGVKDTRTCPVSGTGTTVIVRKLQGAITTLEFDITDLKWLFGIDTTIVKDAKGNACGVIFK